MALLGKYVIDSSYATYASAVEQQNRASEASLHPSYEYGSVGQIVKEEQYLKKTVKEDQ